MSIADPADPTHLPTPTLYNSYVFPAGLQTPYQPAETLADRWIFAKPELIPLHLTWIFTLALAVLAYKAWTDAKDTTEKLNEQVKEAGKSANALNDQVKLLQSEQRAWVSATSAVTDEFSPNNNALFIRGKLIAEGRFDFVVRNSGKTPARYVQLQGDLIYGRSHRTVEMWKHHQPLSLASPTCQYTKKGTKLESGTTIFPNAQQRLVLDVGMPGSKLARWQAAYAAGDDPNDIMVSGCVDYFVGDDTTRHHQSTFVFKIVKASREKVNPNEGQDGQIAGLYLIPIGDALIDAD